MDRAKLLPVIPNLNKVSPAGLHVDRPLKANALVYTAARLRLEALRTRVEVTGCLNNQVLSQEDSRRDFGCWLNCSNWRLNEFTELEGRG